VVCWAVAKLELVSFSGLLHTVPTLHNRRRQIVCKFAGANMVNTCRVRQAAVTNLPPKLLRKACSPRARVAPSTFSSPCNRALQLADVGGAAWAVTSGCTKP
jgi:hypothetical protein